jgi:hypothetical protein
MSTPSTSTWASTDIIYSESGDSWDGKTLEPDAFKQRVITSRGPVPDLRFELGGCVAEGNRAALNRTIRPATSVGTAPRR